MNDNSLRVLHVVEGTSVDGPGLRTSIYLAGCDHRCKGCHNPESWDPGGGEERTLDQLMEIIAYNEAPVTFSGGDPLMHPEPLARLMQRIKEELGYNIWCYTGFTWEQVIASPRLLNVMKWVDVLVDSPFLLEQRNTRLRFRGSDNQRIINVPATLASGAITLWQE